VAPLSGQSAGSKISTGKAQLTCIHVQDAADMQHARFMESFESRHSDHSFTAAVVSDTGFASCIQCCLLPYLLTPHCNRLVGVLPWHVFQRMPAATCSCVSMLVVCYTCDFGVLRRLLAGVPVRCKAVSHVCACVAVLAGPASWCGAATSAHGQPSEVW
jgi:hypothetical protein